MTKKVLILGGDGLLGPYIKDFFLKQEFKVFTASRSSGNFRFDCTELSSVNKLIESISPDIILHLIALTNVDECQRRPAFAQSINSKTVENVVHCLSANTKLIYISTDQVYPDQSGLHTEHNVAPLNVYGKTKLLGEKAALLHPNSLVLRTNIFGPSQTNNRESISDFFIRSFMAKKRFNIFSDSYFSPLHMATLAKIIHTCMEQELKGVYNLGSRSGMSKADFALNLAAHLKLNSDFGQKTISSNLNNRVKRPKDMRLDVSKIEMALEVNLPTLQEEIFKL